MECVSDAPHGEPPKRLGFGFQARHVRTKLGDLEFEPFPMRLVAGHIVRPLAKLLVLALQRLNLALQYFVLVFELIAVDHVLVYNSGRDTCHRRRTTRRPGLLHRRLPLERAAARQYDPAWPRPQSR